MSCAYVKLRYRIRRSGAHSKHQGIPMNDDGTPAKDVALRLPATSRQIHAETRLLIFALTTFKIPQFYQARWVSDHAYLRNIQSLRISNAGLWHFRLRYRTSIDGRIFNQVPHSKSGYLTESFPRLVHLELAPRTADGLHDFDHLDPEDEETRTMKGAEFYRRLLEQRIREREGRPWLTFSWK